MRNFTWNRFPIKNLLIDSLLTPIVESTYFEICASLNHRKETKADGSRLIPRKHTETLVLLSVVSFNVTFLPLWPYYEKMCTCFSKDAESLNNVWLRAFDAVWLFFMSLFSEHYNRISLCVWVLERWCFFVWGGSSITHSFFTWPRQV